MLTKQNGKKDGKNNKRNRMGVNEIRNEKRNKHSLDKAFPSSVLTWLKIGTVTYVRQEHHRPPFSSRHVMAGRTVLIV